MAKLSVIPHGWRPAVLCDELAAGYADEKTVETFMSRIGTVFANRSSKQDPERERGELSVRAIWTGRRIRGSITLIEILYDSSRREIEMSIDKTTIHSMAKAGIQFLISARVPGGGENMLLSPTEVETYLADKTGTIAAKFGSTKDEYIAWVESEGNVQCSATTSAGHRCRNYISGGGQMEIGEWKKAQGGHCAVHGGEGSRHSK